MLSFPLIHIRSQRRRNLSALMLVASAATLMLSSAPGSGNHLRLSRFLSSTQPDISGEVSPAIANQVKELSASLLADESNIFAFDETDPRPVVNTFFAIPEGQSIREDDSAILAVWRQTWSAAGWNPRILGNHNVQAHPEYAEIITKLNEEVPLGGNVFYDRSCYLRHFAMAASGGGWMTDYDTVPLNMIADVYGKDLPNYGRFTTFENHVPSLIVGNSDEWDRVAKALLREGVDAAASTEEGGIFSDMNALQVLIAKNEVISFQPHSVLEAGELLELIGDDINAQWMSDFLHRQTGKTSCEETRNVMAVHFSHASTEHYQYLGARALIMAEMLTRWSRLCEGPNFHFGDPDANAPADGDNSSNNNNAGAASLYNSEPITQPQQPGTDIWVINQPKSGTGFLVSTIANAKQCKDSQEAAKQVRSYVCPPDGTRVFRTHSTTQASKLRLYESLTPVSEKDKFDTLLASKRKCFVVSGVRNPNLSIPSRFFESNKDRFCDGDQTKEEILNEYDDWLRVNSSPRLQMKTTDEVTKAFGIQDFAYALNEMSNSGFALFEGPSDPTSPWRGCQLLLLQLDFEENNNNIASGLSLILHDDVAPAEYSKRSDLCPRAADNYNAIKEYELPEDILNVLTQDNPELRHGVDYYRRFQEEPVVDLIA